MAPKFGTSGLRGLVTELTPELVRDYTLAFLNGCPTGGAVHVAWDLRPSSPAIAEVVISAIRTAGVTAVRHGALPTPALALHAMAKGQAAIMVTGSHIPADRNGLKFYVPLGEITKEDEAAILSRLGKAPQQAASPGNLEIVTDSAATYTDRYVSAFGPNCLSGLRIGVYEHSSVARDILVETVTALGATALRLARSDRFIPVDTEAVDEETRRQLAEWCRENRLDALISTDGDADRPMVADEIGMIVPGDVLGAITARSLGSSTLCIPVSANTMVEQMPGFERISRTKIGSPFVIAAMEAELAKDPDARVVGYEPNGGFLLGFTAATDQGALAPLMTRDCLLPILAPLVAARKAGQSLSQLVAGLPARFTAADRLSEIPTDLTTRLISRLANFPDARAQFFDTLGPVAGIDQTDGLRLSFGNGEIVHLRPSGNAPECRCYAEADTRQRARDLVATYLVKLRQALSAD